MKRRLIAGLVAMLLGLSLGIDSLADKPSGEGGNIRVACVGDSITFGGRPRNTNPKAYPFQLQRILGDKYLVANFGVSGATLLEDGDKPYVKTDQYGPAHEFQPDIVVIKLGTNDTKPQNWKHKSEYVSDYLALIDGFAALESDPDIFICYPVPAYPGRWGISDEVIRNEIIPFIDRIADRRDVEVIDLYKALSGKKEFFPDTVHPNAEGYGLIAASVAEALKQSDGKD